MITLKHLDVIVAHHRTSDLLMTVCLDVPRLTVHARSLPELDDKLPGAIRELFEVSGTKVCAVETMPRALPQAEGRDMPAAIISADVALSVP